MRKLRKFHVDVPAQPKSDINVTPLVDVVLVLLIIFMVVTPLLDKMLRVRVPDATEQEQQQPQDNTQVVVSVDPDGNIAINSDKIPDQQYVDRLAHIMSARSHGDRLVFFTADDKAKYPRVVMALDGARKAGAEILTMTTDPMPAGAGVSNNTPVPTTPP